jgi:hypothetical protein
MKSVTTGIAHPFSRLSIVACQDYADFSEQEEGRGAARRPCSRRLSSRPTARQLRCQKSVEADMPIPDHRNRVQLATHAGRNNQVAIPSRAGPRHPPEPQRVRARCFRCQSRPVEWRVTAQPRRPMCRGEGRLSTQCGPFARCCKPAFWRSYGFDILDSSGSTRSPRGTVRDDQPPQGGLATRLRLGRENTTTVYGEGRMGYAKGASYVL